MRLGHFRGLAPRCPRCLAAWRQQPGRDAPGALVLGGDAGMAGDADEVLAGMLTCPDCGGSYPILQGLPVLVLEPERFIADHLVYFLLPQALPDDLEAWMARAFADTGWFAAMQRHCSTYGFDHYGDCDAGDTGDWGAAVPGSVTRCLAAGLHGVTRLPLGPVLDAGCAAGRSSFALAERTAAPVLGIDLNVPLLRLARQALHDGTVAYPLRAIGNSYLGRTVAFAPACRERVDFWVADAHHPPFLPAGFGCLAALNLVDCLEKPAEALRALRTLVTDDGLAVICHPYDWGETVTPAAAWIGGGAIGPVSAGGAEADLRRCLAETGWRIVHEVLRHPWQVRLHRRAVVHYDSHVLRLAPSRALDAGAKHADCHADISKI